MTGRARLSRAFGIADERPLFTMHRTASQTGSVPSRSRILTKFSENLQGTSGSPRCKFGERGSIDADVVNYA